MKQHREQLIFLSFCPSFGQGNKGAVAIRFRFYDSTFCIVNAHFNAHQTNVQRRNQDYHDIVNKIVFYVDNQLVNITDHEYSIVFFPFPFVFSLFNISICDFIVMLFGWAI